MNDTQKSILKRRSTRGFSDEKLTAEELALLQDAALAAPTACNYQDWHFTFVQNHAMLDEFAEDYRKIAIATMEKPEKFVNYDVFFHAPLCVFITLPEDCRSRFAEVDAGIAVQNLALSAQGMGLGSVILGRPKEVFTGEKGAEWERRFAFPEKHHFAIAIVIGHNTVTKDAHPIADGKISFVN